jgi:flagellar biosynthetic protein FliR
MSFTIGGDLALAFGLMFTRAAAFIMAMPRVLGVSIPTRISLLLSMLLAGALMPLAKLYTPAVGGVVAVALMVAREATVGVVLSFALAVVVGAVTIVGELVGTSMELNSGDILRGSVQMPNVLGDGLATLTGLLFFVAGFHRALDAILRRLFRGPENPSVWILGLGLLGLLGLLLFCGSLDVNRIQSHALHRVGG